MRLPLDIRDLMRSGTEFRDAREQPVRVAVFVDAAADDVLVEAAREALRPQMSTALMHVEAVAAGEELEVDRLTDVVIAIAGPTGTLAASLKHARDVMVPCVVVAMGEDKTAVSVRLDHPILDTIAADDPDSVVKELGAWLVDRVAGKRLALAANFAFARKAVAEESVKGTAFQNAVIGGVMFVPGADMPLMTANQAKMILQIAAAYGQPLGAERIKELAAVVGGAFVFRTIARQLLGFVPGFGWAVKAGIGYSGTLAMGYAAIEYFEEGGDVRGLAERVRQARDRVMDKARGSQPEEGPIPAHAWVADEVIEGPDPVLPPADPRFELPSEERS